MIINKLLRVVLVILSITYIVLEVFKFKVEGDFSRLIMLCLLTVLYVRENLGKRAYLLYFFIIFTCSEALGVMISFYPIVISDADIGYYLCNILYIISYVFLILRCTLTMKFKIIIKRFSITLIVLVILGVFCVTLITNTARAQLNSAEYIFEIIYNSFVMTLLSVGLLNYMQNNDNKSMLFFIGVLFIFFYEMIQLTYYYIADMTHLAVLYSLFLVLAFLFFYLQSRLKHSKIKINDLHNITHNN